MFALSSDTQVEATLKTQHSPTGTKSLDEVDRGDRIKKMVPNLFVYSLHSAAIDLL